MELNAKSRLKQTCSSLSIVQIVPYNHDTVFQAPLPVITKFKRSALMCIKYLPFCHSFYAVNVNMISKK